MSMQKLRGITRRGTYTAQRSMVEHLLLLEEAILEKTSEKDDISKVHLAKLIKKYKRQHRFSNPFGIEDIQHYLLATAEREIPRRKSQARGHYTSLLIEQADGDEPITIDMKGGKIDYLLNQINTPRHITINNTTGDWTGASAGSFHGQAHLTINNTEGDYVGALAGSSHGNANLTITNTKGDCTGSYVGDGQGNANLTITNTEGDHTGAVAGRRNGRAHLTINNTIGNYTGAYACENGTGYLTINNTKGNYTGAEAGKNHGNAHIIITNTEGDYTGNSAGCKTGNAIIVGYNNKGKEQFLNHKGTIINYNSKERPRIEGVTDKQRRRILTLIKQNASPEEILEVLRRTV